LRVERQRARIDQAHRGQSGESLAVRSNAELGVRIYRLRVTQIRYTIAANVCVISADDCNSDARDGKLPHSLDYFVVELPESVVVLTRPRDASSGARRHSPRDKVSARHRRGTRHRKFHGKSLQEDCNYI
jgi:hypothetical protein